jgi:hypothetical protein
MEPEKDDQWKICKHRWEQQNKWSNFAFEGGIRRHKCAECGIWAYSNPPNRVEPIPFAGPIWEPKESWKRYANARCEKEGFGPAEFIAGGFENESEDPPDNWVDPDEVFGHPRR